MCAYRVEVVTGIHHDLLILIAITSSTELVIWLNLFHAYILFYMLINSTLRLIGLSQIILKLHTEYFTEYLSEIVMINIDLNICEIIKVIEKFYKAKNEVSHMLNYTGD